ncbi:metallo-beta-lactamase domain-containing protein 1-like [Rhopilema esculentum]|uniref:metallo-beta-lactamase domain-containing protein 1-like n=1 Tax=Rhopilema esculentum TaxID=499914 RepID=UPI0031CEA209|eukprot:gene193-9821_t
MSSGNDDFNVKVLIEGYSFEENSQYRATGTSTLVTGPVNIVVDTGGPWDKQRLLKALDDNNVKPENIDFVVCTHGHSDHVGNLNLFTNAKHIVGYDINYKDNYYDHDFKGGKPYPLYKELVTVIPTPGHMHNDVSVIVHAANSFGTVAICGDLFESQDDEDSWKEFSEWPEEQVKNRDKLKKMATFIIPGHGPMFKVEH